MGGTYQRREVFQMAGAAALGTLLPGIPVPGAGGQSTATKGKGCIIGQPQAAAVGAEVLAAGGNAVDAIAAAALVAGVVDIRMCGPGGYGGHMVIALPGAKKVTAIDFNSAAPAAARPDMFPLDGKGEVKGKVNMYGWLAAGVPGTLAGIQLALDHYGTQSFAKLVQPAIRLARDGFKVDGTLSSTIQAARAQLESDPGSAKLLLKGGKPPPVGSTFRNPDLADLLQTLAERKSVESFYRGDIGRKIAAAFHKGGGLVTAADMAAYRAWEVAPLELAWNGFSIRTAPLTAGGATVLEALLILKALHWDKLSDHDPKATHAQVEALRLAWHDRVQWFGDPEKAEVPIKRLLSEPYARVLADRVAKAVKEKRPVPAETDGRKADGTIHLSAVDARGMMAAMTLTHGGTFGARVTVDGLGLILGHGMSRFDPYPGRPNSPGPGKRPLHNMCPTVVLRDGHPILAFGGRGGRRIPNAVFEVLLHAVGRGRAMAEAVAALRLHTEGGMDVSVEPKWPEDEVTYLGKVGYRVKRGPSAVVSAVFRDPKSGECRTAMR
jgi:gamma-glutamyltranspeptidase/glutathione hydrolase